MKSYLLGTIHLTGNSYWLTCFSRYCRLSLFFHSLPPESIERILLAVIRGSSFNWPVHTFVTYHNLRNVCKFSRLILNLERAKQLLPQVYVPYNNVLPKNRLGIKVNMQWITQNAGSFSGLVLELKRIINNHRWNKAWLDLIILLHGRYIITNIFWKIKNGLIWSYYCMVGT